MSERLSLLFKVWVLLFFVHVLPLSVFLVPSSSVLKWNPFFDLEIVLNVVLAFLIVSNGKFLDSHERFFWALKLFLVTEEAVKQETWDHVGEGHRFSFCFFFEMDVWSGVWIFQLGSLCCILWKFLYTANSTIVQMIFTKIVHNASWELKRLARLHQ